MSFWNLLGEAVVFNYLWKRFSNKPNHDVQPRPNYYDEPDEFDPTFDLSGFDPTFDDESCYGNHYEDFSNQNHLDHYDDINDDW